MHRNVTEMQHKIDQQHTSEAYVLAVAVHLLLLLNSSSDNAFASMKQGKSTSTCTETLVQYTLC
jgi:hypothetical protein